MLAIEVLGSKPLWANFAAFCVAFCVSFAGHFHWSFRDATARGRGNWKIAFPKFVVVALAGLALNTLAVYVVTDILAANYLYATLIMVSFVPAIVYLLSKYWAFN